MGSYFRDEQLIPSIVLCSPARRALETWEAVAPFLGIAVPVRAERELYIASPDRLLERIRRLDEDVSSVLIVGHHTGIDVLAINLAGNGDATLIKKMKSKFPTAALAVIDVKLNSWSELTEGSGKLTSFVAPKELV